MQSLSMDTWQDEMYDNMAGHSQYSGVPYLTSTPDSKYLSSPDVGFMVEKEVPFTHSEMLNAKSQVNWLDAPSAGRVNWLKDCEGPSHSKDCSNPHPFS